MRVAESILFAGKAIRVLRNPSPSFRREDALYHLQMPRGSQKLQGLTGRFSFQKEPLMDAKLMGEELLPQTEADKIEAMLLDLKVVCTTVLCNIFVVCNPTFDGYLHVESVDCICLLHKIISSLNCSPCTDLEDIIYTL